MWVHPDFPDHQSAHYLLIVSFLRGSTNPPPEKWFTRAETWSKKVREEGIFVTVPDEAEQAVIFLAPETGGDFSTLRSAVRGQTGLLRARRTGPRSGQPRPRPAGYLSGRDSHDFRKRPVEIQSVSVLLARSLNIRLDDDCFKKPVDEQATCLTQKGGDLVLNDGHSQSVVGAITNGAPSDLIGQLSYTAQASYGYFSPYVGAIIDLGRILDSLAYSAISIHSRTEPAERDQLQLKLNNPPSFHNPKSVIVIALPAVKKEEPPPLRAVDAHLAGVHAEKSSGAARRWRAAGLFHRAGPRLVSARGNQVRQGRGLARQSRCSPRWIRRGPAALGNAKLERRPEAKL